MKDIHFNFDKTFTPMNHGSFGTFPKIVRDRQRELQDLTEARPDTFLDAPTRICLEKSRRTVVPLLGVSMDEVVFVPNANTGVNAVLQNLVYRKGDVILHFSTVYGACEKTIDSLYETAQIERACIEIDYPVENKDIVCKFNDVAQKLTDEGKRIKVAMFDTVLTFPSARFSWEALVKLAKGWEF